GGVATGRAVVRAAAQHLTPTLMELGGKSAIVVLPGADPAEAARIVAPAVAFRTGQACTCPSRIVAVGDDGRAQDGGAAIAGGRAGREMAPPDEEATTLGPAISPQQAERVRSFLDDAMGAGATLLGSSDEPGPEFLAPSVVMGADPSGRVVREEVFGP